MHPFSPPAAIICVRLETMTFSDHSITICRFIPHLIQNNKFDFDANNKIISNINPIKYANMYIYASATAAALDREMGGVYWFLIQFPLCLLPDHFDVKAGGNGDDTKYEKRCLYPIQSIRKRKKYASTKIK